MEENKNQSNTQQNSTAENDEINLIDYLHVIYKYRRMIVWICGIVVVTTAIISLLVPKVYSADVSIVPPLDLIQKQSTMLGKLGAGSALLNKAIGISNIADLYASILESRAVVDSIVNRFDLMKVYKEKKYKSNVRKKLKSNTSITVSDEGIVTVTVEDLDPSRAAAMANAYMEELDRQNKRLSAGTATSKRFFLKNRLKEIEQELSKIENLLSREAKIKEMLYELLTREYEIAKIEEAKSMPTIQILDRAIASEKRCKPKRMRMIILSATIALFAAVFAAFAREYFAKVNAPANEGSVDNKST